MKKGEVVTGVGMRTLFGGKGEVLVTEEGQEKGTHVLVPGVLPGQTVKVRVLKARKGKCTGMLLDVIAPSPEEIPADCPHFGACGGCIYRTLPYERQLALKEEQVKALLLPVCPDLPFEGILPSPQIAGYRNKMEFSFGDACKDGPLCLGMHRRGSFYDIVTVDQCQIVDADFRLILQTVLTLCAEAGLSYFHRNTHEGYLRHLLLRKAAHTGEILADLVTTTQISPEEETVFLERFARQLQALPLEGTLVGVLHTRNDSIADIIANDHTEILAGRDYFYEELLGLRFRITPFSFFQTNSYGAQTLYETVRAYVGETRDKTIFDLYSGTGTIAQILAPVAREVTGVELVEEAVEAARQNAAENRLTHCSFIAGDVLKVVDELTQKPDLIVLDPPRDGIHPKALPKIIRFGVPRIVYVSCKPTSLARDLAVLQQAGYRVERCCCVDMFPGTAGIETVCLLSNRKRKPDSYVKVSLDMEDYYKIKDEQKAKEEAE